MCPPERNVRGARGEAECGRDVTDLEVVAVAEGNRGASGLRKLLDEAPEVGALEVPDDDIFDVERRRAVDGVERDRPTPFGGSPSRVIAGDGGLDFGRRRMAAEIVRRALGPGSAGSDLARFARPLGSDRRNTWRR